MMVSVCFFSILLILMQEKFFMNLLLLFELLMLGVFSMCMVSGMISGSSVLGYLCITILCMEVSTSVLGLALLVNCSRFTGKSKVHSFSFLSF
uniref:NADH dehydrogenase subunit 4L n=1 Tax=Venerupis aspera TaxID=2784313 RepID=UPI001BED63BB|nr:NADH dehydrogenase subunit 4L [Venerupis aspera]YP_010455423.1 NADH dehydrogenase subunit 4L [Ruditapes variegatus]QUA05878.1 NADH dehydrogenase subunit 4L [Venerupis aspera]UUA63028.1 NADH dehydrogenase subunit 4L [Ruditapes variegatus]